MKSFNICGRLQIEFYYLCKPLNVLRNVEEPALCTKIFTPDTKIMDEVRGGRC